MQLAIYAIAAISLTTATLYFLYKIIRIARRSLISKILYDLLIVIILLWLHSFAIVFLLTSMWAWQFFYALVYFALPIASLYLLWDVLIYTGKKLR
jgi:hypothetical protein